MDRLAIVEALRTQAGTTVYGGVSGMAPYGKAASDTSAWKSFRAALRLDVRRLDAQLPVVMELTGLQEREAIGLIAR